MRLLNAKTMRLGSFTENGMPPFAILSHTWGDEEITYEDIKSGLETARKEAAFSKIRYTVAQAKADGLEWVWIDTCCIDKSSSAELQEAINSMYRWYNQSQVCYVYLTDFVFASDERPQKASTWAAEMTGEQDGKYATAFAKTRWFSRGWTLQELIAPEYVKFYTRRWELIGTKLVLSPLLSYITSVDSAILENKRAPVSVSVATRMSWAATRQTTRVEDQAYCLLGLFEVNIPMLYGEGSRAFVRLQEEIIRSSNDQSIFAWGLLGNGKGSLLAQSPADFVDCKEVIPWGRPGQYEMTNRGLRVTLPLLADDFFEVARSSIRCTLGLLRCRFDNNFDGTLALRLQETNEKDVWAVISDTEAIASIQDVDSVRGAIRGTSHVPHSALLAGTFGNDEYDFDKASYLGRLAFVDTSRSDSAKRAQIYIARSYEPRRPLPAFRLRLLADESGDTHIRVIKCHPAEFWNREANVMRIPMALEKQQFFEKGIAVLSCERSQQSVAVYLAHDKILTQEDAAGQYVSTIVPSMQVFPIDTAQITDLAQLSKAHKSFKHHRGYCNHGSIDGQCSHAYKTLEHMWPTSEGSELITLSLSQLSVMEEPLFQVDVRLQCFPHEMATTSMVSKLHTEHFVQSGTLATSEYPTKAYLDAYHAASQLARATTELCTEIAEDDENELASSPDSTQTVTSDLISTGLSANKEKSAGEAGFMQGGILTESGRPTQSYPNAYQTASILARATAKFGTDLTEDDTDDVTSAADFTQTVSGDPACAGLSATGDDLLEQQAPSPQRGDFQRYLATRFSQELNRLLGR